MKNFVGIINSAMQEYRRRRSLEKNGRPELIAQQVARRYIPLRSEELLALAAENLHLALKSPRHGPAFSKRATPVNLIAANLYEAICISLKDQADPSAEDGSFHKKKLC